MTTAGPRQRRGAAKEKPKPPPMSSAFIDPGENTGPAPTYTPPCPLSPHFKGPMTPCSKDGDEAAGPQKRNSVSEPGLLPKFCRCIPGLIFFPLLFSLIFSAIFSQRLFYWIAAVLTAWTTVWTIHMLSGCVMGLWRMRRDVATDWHAKVKQMQKESSEADKFMHIVFLPNYKENEAMLDRTLKNLARSAMASDYMHVVLACEEREGPEGKEKAARLIESNRKLFADMFATFHPVGLPGDVPGKSSNCQWAYKHALEKWAFKLVKVDFSQVYVTCCDADTLFHPQYFSAIAYQGLCMSKHERAWSIWQPPILLLRNLFACPGPTRLSGYATLLFELSGLSHQKYVPHFCFSTYSLTLELSLHQYVRGWDRDVIAEDHHMFCKCYYASIWEQLEDLDNESTPVQASEQTNITSALKLQPVYLPAISYLVQSDDGWVASIYARFVQARRHSQGLAELSYSTLQYFRVCLSGHAGRLDLSTHAKMLAIPAKMANVHIISSMQTFAFLLTITTFLPSAWSWLLSLGFHDLLQASAARGFEAALSFQSFVGFRWLLCTIFGPIPPIGMMMSATIYFVVRDTLEGKLTGDPANSKEIGANELAAPDVEGSARGPHGLGWWKRVQLALMVQSDVFGGAFITLFCYGMLPASMAAWFLLWKSDSGFKYIVGEKPREAVVDCNTVCACPECLSQAGMQPGSSCRKGECAASKSGECTASSKSDVK